MSIQRVSGSLALALSFALLGCSDSEKLSTRGQLIECEVAADGTVSNCNPTDDPSGATGTCVDIDEDGDGDAHDEAEEGEDVSSFTGRPEDDDDDGDGVPNGDDCDEYPGGDGDD